MLLCLLPSIHPYGCLHTSQKLSINDKEVTERARRVCPPPSPRQPLAAAASSLEIRGPWGCFLQFLLFSLFLLRSFQAPFVAVSGFETQLGPDVPS